MLGAVQQGLLQECCKHATPADLSGGSIRDAAVRQRQAAVVCLRKRRKGLSLVEAAAAGRANLPQTQTTR